jgi:hypothetical protein
MTAAGLKKNFRSERAAVFFTAPPGKKKTGKLLVRWKDSLFFSPGDGVYWGFFTFAPRQNIPS